VHGRVSLSRVRRVVGSVTEQHAEGRVDSSRRRTRDLSMYVGNSSTEKFSGLAGSKIERSEF